MVVIGLKTSWLEGILVTEWMNWKTLQSLNWRIGRQDGGHWKFWMGRPDGGHWIEDMVVIGVIFTSDKCFTMAHLSVLWKDARKGRGGSISTNTEYFNGMVHKLEVVGWIFFTTSAEMRLLKITEVTPLMYVPPTDEEWSVAPGGRCFKTSQCLATMRKFRQCPVADCKKWFNGVDPFQPHSATLHAPQ